MYLQILSISPIKSQVPPGSSCMCSIMFKAKGVPAFYDLDLICEVMDDSEMANYHKQLAKWEKERERQKVEFTITEKDLHADERVGSAVELVVRDYLLMPKEND